MMVFAIEAREVGGQRVDEVLPVLCRAAALEIVEVSIEARQPETPDDLAETGHHECALGLAQGDAGDLIDAGFDAAEFAVAEGDFSRFHTAYPVYRLLPGAFRKRVPAEPGDPSPPQRPEPPSARRGASTKPPHLRA